MNPFLNPSIAIPFLKNYIADINRIERLSSTDLEKYRNKAFRKIVEYAYTVPLYKRKYKEAGIHPSDIKDLKDITKIPFVSRQELNENFPDGIVPPTFNKQKGLVICTGGTTGKYCCSSGSEPVCIYTNVLNLLRGILVSFRENRFYGLNLKNTRFAHIGNFNPFKIDEVFDKNVMKHIRSFFSFKNYLAMQASNRTREILDQLNDFQPNVIISYPTIFQDLAYLKKKGFGKNIKPKILFVGGAMLDDYTRSYVENVFGCHMYNTYSSCESGAEIAFECTQRNWHIHSDFFHLEAVNENLEPVSPGKRGHLVITRLWGGGTPLIRYTGMKDWITLGNGKNCSCGLKSPIFGRPVEGRVLSNIILPNGTMYPPSDFLFTITNVLKSFNTFKVLRYQIIQKKIDEIEIQLVIDQDLNDTDPTFNELAKQIEKKYREKTGPGVNITVNEVEEIKDDPTTGKPAPLVVSQLNQNSICNLT